MKTLCITYSENTTALLDELPPEYVYVDEATGERGIRRSEKYMPRTRTIRSGSETVAVCQELPVELQGLQHLTVLGSFEVNSRGLVCGNTQANNGITWADPANQAIYERVAQRPALMLDELGNPILGQELPYITCIF